jgi:thioredoxin-related protein
MIIKRYLFKLLLIVSTGLVHAETLPSTQDWADAAVLAKQNHIPILVIFESENCGFCERLKQEILIPLPHTCTLQPPLIKEFDIYSRGKVTDFNGELIRTRRFKNRYHIYAVPTVLFLDPEGNPLTEPIVGYNLQQEKYRKRLHSSLIASYKALR